MTRKFSDLRNEAVSDPERRARIEQMRRAMEDAVRLAEIREQRQASQQQMAGRLGISQARISQIEHANDLYLSTLTEYVEGLGGQLKIAAVFPDQEINIQVPRVGD